MAKKLLIKPIVCERVGCKRSKLDGMIRAGEFPKPLKIGATVVWPEHEVDDWIDARIAERDAALAAIGGEE